MPSVIVNAKEFKSILKTFSTLADHSSRRSPVVTMSCSPKFIAVLSTDTMLLTSEPKDVKDCDNEGGDISINPEILQNLSIKGKEFKLSWAEPESPVCVQDGKFISNLKMAVSRPDFRDYPQSFPSFEVPENLLWALTHYLSVPHAYHKAKKELMPIVLTRDPDTGFLVGFADDGFSLARVETQFPVTADFEIKTPKYMLDCLYPKRVSDMNMVRIGSMGTNILMQNSNTLAFFTGVNDSVADFEGVYRDQKNTFFTSYTFNPSSLLSAIDPLMSLLKKAASGEVLTADVGTSAINMSLKNDKSFGEASVSEIPGVKDIFNENGIQRVILHFHPAALYEYTALLKEISDVRVYGNNSVIYYEANSAEDGYPLKIRYLFPTAQV